MNYEGLKYYAGAVTAILALIGYSVLMLRYTDEDMAKVIISFFLFVFPVAFGIPFYLTEGGSYDSERTDP